MRQKNYKKNKDIRKRKNSESFQENKKLKEKNENWSKLPIRGRRIIMNIGGGDVKENWLLLSVKRVVKTIFRYFESVSVMLIASGSLNATRKQERCFSFTSVILVDLYTDTTRDQCSGNQFRNFGASFMFQIDIFQFGDLEICNRHQALINISAQRVDEKSF